MNGMNGCGGYEQKLCQANHLAQEALQRDWTGCLNSPALVEAERLYNELMKDDPNRIDAYRGLGMLASHVGSEEKGTLVGGIYLDKAEKCLSAVIRRNAATAADYFNLAGVLRDRGDWDGAIRHYESALALNRDCQTMCNLGVMHYNKEDDKKAIECFLCAIELAPDKDSPMLALVYRNLANAYHNICDFDNERKAILRAEKLGQE